MSRFPTAIKSFYMQPDPQDPEVVLGLDMLAPEGYGEIIGGSQRIHDLALLERRLEEHKLPREAYEWYLDVRRYGTFPHSGLRHGPRALRDVDLRDPPPARGDSVSADAQADLPVSRPCRKASRRVGIVSLGCPKNLVDTEVMLGHLARAGHAIVPDGEARVVLVNTCGFIDKAKEESVEAILEQVERKRRGEIDRVVVAGCMVQKYGRELAREIPEVDALRRARRAREGSGGRRGLPSLPRFTDKPLATRLYDEAAPRVLSRRRGYAYLKVGEGCDNPCTFCTIPQMRGFQRSRSIASLVAEARALEAQGVSELVLISQDTTRYGEDLGMKRAGAGAARRGAARGDVVSLDPLPLRLSEDARRLGARRDGAGAAVRALRRHSAPARLPARSSRRCAAAATRRPTCAMIARMRERVPDIAIRTTFIVGFPGEGEAEFGELCEFVREAEFDNLGAFTYSPEPGSGSEPLGDPVPAEEKERRKDFLLSLQQPIARRQSAGRCAAAPSRRSSRGRARRPSTCSRGGCARRRRRSTGGS